jgi:hypothetical protein
METATSSTKMYEAIQNREYYFSKRLSITHLIESAKRIHWATVEDAEDVDEDGILIDIDVQSIADSGPTYEDKT